MTEDIIPEFILFFVELYFLTLVKNVFKFKNKSRCTYKTILSICYPVILLTCYPVISKLK